MLTRVARRLRIRIVDPSVVVRRAIGRALQDLPGVEVCGAAPDGPTALRRCHALAPSPLARLGATLHERVAAGRAVGWAQAR